MNYRKIEKLGIELSVLGFGCMRLPVGKDGKIERTEATEMLDYAYKNGVNYFDTAWGYHGEESQYFLGETMSKYPRDSFYMATKMPIWLVKEPSDLDKYFAEQLSRMKTDYIDFYLLHAMGKDRYDIAKKNDAFNWIKKMKAEGKVKYIGFSYHDLNENFDMILNEIEWDFVQIQHNYIDSRHINSGELYDKIKAKGIPALVMEPVRGGHLANLPDEVMDILRTCPPERSAAEWALRWVASQDNILVTLSGMSTLDQVKENVATFSAPTYTLSDAEMATVGKAADKLLSYKNVPCTGCHYCMDCPFGVDIPRVFEIYNRYMMFKNDDFARRDYYGPMMDPGERASSCTKCGTCSPQCPQQIDIPDRLEYVHSVLSKLE